MSIVIATTIDIDAPRMTVWEVLADFRSYGEWSIFSGALVWPFQGLFRRTGNRRETGYDGFNRPLKRRVESIAG